MCEILLPFFYRHVNVRGEQQESLVLHLNHKPCASFTGSSHCNCIAMAKFLQMEDKFSSKK